ncbi:hypothetical protein TNCT_532301 [Trichonephila clavata]|uniref:Uncharacterized protein n=1 Tax=Trichonephila clavata TaxID=2740835 RepID=A0A8X6J1Q5_TRICU|nr:hypothetical protein TNCT_532301 [Trichonephila clavata]
MRLSLFFVFKPCAIKSIRRSIGYHRISFSVPTWLNKPPSIIGSWIQEIAGSCRLQVPVEEILVKGGFGCLQEQEDSFGRYSLGLRSSAIGIRYRYGSLSPKPTSLCV